MQKYPEVWPWQNWWRSRGSSQRAEFRPPTVSVSSLLFWQDWTEIWRLRRYTLRLVRYEHESLFTEILTWSAWSRRCQYDTRGLSLSSPSSPPPCWCWSVSAGTFPLLNITKLVRLWPSPESTYRDWRSNQTLRTWSSPAARWWWREVRTRRCCTLRKFLAVTHI